MSYEILTALLLTPIEPRTTDYINGIYGYAMRELGRYADAWWYIRHGV